MKCIATSMLVAWISCASPWGELAIASQGPGVTPGSAGAATQLAMAIVVYGGSALLMAAAVIGAARQRRARR
jgi:hypothetical protein